MSGVEPGQTMAPGPAVAPARDASDDFFESGVVTTLKIQLQESQAQKLREDPRTYATCALVETSPAGETTYQGVSIKLKGAAGSFRDLDDKPAFTLNMHKLAKEQTFHAMQRLHLNNSVQDESYLCEWLCSEIARDAKLPAARVAHARVWLNERDLGLYVLKEGFDRPFLTRQFGGAKGNFYDGGFVQDIDAELEKDSGEGPDDHSDLRALQSACQEPDPARRAAALEGRLDLDRFLTFMAFELMTCHWDGYTGNRNNYRIYFNPPDGKAVFIPHGMDQMFGDPGFPILDYFEPMVASAVMHEPGFRTRYRERVAAMLPLFEPRRLQERLDAALARLRPVVAEMGEPLATEHAERVRELKERIAERAPSIREQLEQGDPSPLEFDGDQPLPLADWFPMQETDDAKVEELESDGRKLYSIQVGESGECVASWRRKALLARGRYRIEAKLRTAGVVARADAPGTGAGVRLSGGERDNRLSGDSDWRSVSHEFDVLEEARDVVIVIELRATSGQLWIEPVSNLFRVATP